MDRRYCTTLSSGSHNCKTGQSRSDSDFPNQLGQLIGFDSGHGLKGNIAWGHSTILAMSHRNEIVINSSKLKTLKLVYLMHQES